MLNDIVRRLSRLLVEIMAEAENKTLIFVETNRRADELTSRMRREGFVVVIIITLAYIVVIFIILLSHILL